MSPAMWSASLNRKRNRSPSQDQNRSRSRRLSQVRPRHTQVTRLQRLLRNPRARDVFHQGHPWLPGFQEVFMPPIKLIQALLQQAIAEGSRSTALKPLGWLLAMLLPSTLFSAWQKSSSWLTIFLAAVSSWCSRSTSAHSSTCSFTIVMRCVPRPTPYAKWRYSTARQGTACPESSRQMKRGRFPPRPGNDKWG